MEYAAIVSMGLGFAGAWILKGILSQIGKEPKLPKWDGHFVSEVGRKHSYR